jgi:hypothetical protein
MVVFATAFTVTDHRSRYLLCCPACHQRGCGRAKPMFARPPNPPPSIEEWFEPSLIDPDAAGQDRPLSEIQIDR